MVIRDADSLFLPLSELDQLRHFDVHMPGLREAVLMVAVAAAAVETVMVKAMITMAAMAVMATTPTTTVVMLVNKGDF